MFPTSTHAQNWMFGDESSVRASRAAAHNLFVERHSVDMPANMVAEHFLNSEEASATLRFYEQKLMEFCVKFKPPMPKCVIGTTFQYFKRFYLGNSIMDFHPKEILVTAAYLACKVEEFNISIEQFVANINGNKERATEVVLNTELLLMRELNFHLTIHHPYRPIEGILIDFKTRCPSMVSDVDLMRPEIDKFLEEVLYTDVCFIYAPSQIALAAIIHAASKSGRNVDSYVTDVLFQGTDTERLMKIVETVKNIRLMVKNVIQPLAPAKVKPIFDKLEQCRNQENNPESQLYKRKVQEMLEEDDDRPMQMY